MAMGFSAIVLFLHVLSVVGFSVSLSFEWLVSICLKRATRASEVQQLMGITKRVPAIGVPSLLLLLATGLYLVAEQGQWGTSWIILSLVAMALMIAVGAGLTGPNSVALQEAVAAEENQPTVSDALRRSFYNKTLGLALRLKTMLLIGLTFLMAAHPNAGVSILCVGISFLIGILWWVLAGRSPERRPA
jgi:hypothetical protein